MAWTLAEPVTSHLDIKKSRFIGCVQPVNSLAQAQQEIALLRAQHPEARHVCFALLLQGQARLSDDGEPSGTAAAPMLNVLQHKELEGVLASVVRYFGGIKLGAGGLVRAYSQAVSQALNDAPLVPIRQLETRSYRAGFEHESLLRRLAEQYDLTIQVDYQQQVQLTLEGEAAQLDAWFTQASEACSGRLQQEADSSSPECSDKV